MVCNSRIPSFGGCSVPIAGRCTLVVWNGPAPVSGTEMAHNTRPGDPARTRGLCSLRHRCGNVSWLFGTTVPFVPRRRRRWTTTRMSQDGEGVIPVGVGNRIQTHMHGMLHVPCPFVICFCFELDLTTQTNQPTNQQQDPDTIQPRIRVYSILLEHVSGNVVTRIVKTGTCVCLLWIQ